MPPPRPGYIRDPDPEGRYPGYDGDVEEITGELKTVTEYNFPAILVIFLVLCMISFSIPINIILWRWAL